MHLPRDSEILLTSPPYRLAIWSTSRAAVNPVRKINEVAARSLRLYDESCSGSASLSYSAAVLFLLYTVIFVTRYERGRRGM